MMHAHVRSSARALLALVAATACERRVSGVDQAADAVVLDHKASVVAAGVVTPHETTLTIGLTEKGVDHKVPVKLEWYTVLDPQGCARIRAVRMTRTGGDRGFEIYDTAVKASEGCGTVDAAGDVKGHQEAQVKYCYRWNGAANRARCAYDGSVTLRGAVGVLTGTNVPLVAP